MAVPGRQRETTLVAGIAIEFLQEMEIVEITAAVAFAGMVGTDDMTLVVAHIHLLVVVGIGKIIVATGIDKAGAGTPAPVAVAQAQELVVGIERTDALDVLQRGALALDGQGAQIDGPAQAAACQSERRSPVQQVGLIDKVGRDGAEIHRTQHG